MKKILLVLTLIGIMTILFLGDFQKEEYGTIKKVSVSSSKTTIQIEETPEKLIIFENLKNFQPGDKIKFQGRRGNYRGEPQIVIEKIFLVKQ